MGSVDMHNHLLKTIQNIKVKLTEAEWRICALVNYAIGSNNGQLLFGARLILETMLSYCTYDTGTNFSAFDSEYKTLYEETAF